MRPDPGSADPERPPPKSPRRKSRVSRFDPRTSLLFGDLHNHSMHSDGAGDPETAFRQMREAGLDVAALTDHASIPHSELHALSTAYYPTREALAVARMAPRSFDAVDWKRTAELADAADEPGVFTAVRGFEWTEPWLGHANVWFSDDYVYVDTPGRVDGLHDWLSSTAPDALFGYNHPGREPGRFDDFRFVRELGRRMVSLEMFNRLDDYLFEGWHSGLPSPLGACLAAGWQPGLIGVSDEHGRSYGLAGKGRTGIWAREHSRAGFREALEARRVFATREPGLRLDAVLGGERMGGALPTGATRLRVDLDLPGGTRSTGSGGTLPEAQLQLLGAGGNGIPDVLLTAWAGSGTVTEVDVEVPDHASWLVLRVADPSRVNASPGPVGHPGNSYGLAYASPWYRARG